MSNPIASRVPAGYFWTMTGENSTCDDGGLGLSQFSIAFYVFRTFEALLSLGNILTICAVVKFRNMHTPANVFIVGLAVFDIYGFLDVCFLYALAYCPKMTWHVWKSVCLVKETLDLISVAGNLLFTCWIAIDRFISLFYALRYYSIATVRRYIIIAVTTAVYCSVVPTMATVLGNNLTVNEYQICTHITMVTRIPRFIIFGHIALAFSITFAVYCRIACLAHRMAANPPGYTEEHRIARIRFERQYKVTKMMATVLGTYYICNVPAPVVSALLPSDPKGWQQHVYYATVVLFCSTSFVDPIIYAWKDPKFRRSYKKCLGIGSHSSVEPVRTISIPNFTSHRMTSSSTEN